MSDRVPLLRRALAGAAAFALVALLLMPGIAPGAAAQPTPSGPTESAEEATVFLQQYRLPDDVAPAGYAHAYDVAWTNPAEAFGSTVGEFPDPRPPEETLREYEAVGRVVQLLSLYTSQDKDAAELWYGINLFRTPEGAAQALKNPMLAESVRSNDRVVGVQLPGLGQGVAAYKVEKLDAEGGVRKRNDIVLWQRGRMVFTLAASGAPAAVDALTPGLPAVADNAASRLAALPEPPATFGPPAAYLPSGIATLQLLQSLHQRLLPDDAFPGLELDVEDPMSIPELMHETPVAAAPISDVRVYKQRAVEAERLIIGLSKAYKTPGAAANPPGSTYPLVNTGYYVYADALGAAEAINAPPAEVALKLYQENADLPSAPIVAEVPLPTVGEQSRAFKATWSLGERPIDTATLRWRRGAVELWVDVSVASGQDVGPLMADAAAKLDGAYAAAPLPAGPSSPAAPGDLSPSDRQTGPPSTGP